jgi:adenosylmethionine-8-amino-7-oxononanoate aminotransferase
MQEPYNISLYPGNGTVDGRKGDHVLLSPAYNVTREDIEKIVDDAAQVIEDFFAEMGK